MPSACAQKLTENRANFYYGVAVFAMIEDSELIWERVRTLKDERGKSLAQISKDSGVPLTSVKRFFNGVTKNPGFLSLCQIIYALGGSVDEVLEISETAKQKIEAAGGKAEGV